MTNQRNDDNADAGIPGHAEVGRAYRRGATERPPTQVDTVILAAARRATRSRFSLPRSPFGSGLYWPVAVAAVAVLSVSVVIMMPERTPAPDQTAPPAAARAAKSRDAPAAIQGQPAEPRSSSEAMDAGGSARAAAPASKENKGESALAMSSLADQADGNSMATEGTEPAVDMEEDRIVARRLRSEAARLKAPAAAGQTPGVIRREAPGMAAPPVPAAHEFLQRLAGEWDGTATVTPMGVVDYAIDFTWDSDDCLSGTAHPGRTPHHWTFCVEAGRLTLVFLSEFGGNEAPIRFHPADLEGDLASFQSSTHEIVSVRVRASGHDGELTVLHRGELHVQIELTKPGAPEEGGGGADDVW